MRVLGIWFALCVVYLLSLSVAETIPNSFIVEVAQDCNAACLRSVNLGAEKAGCIGATSNKLGLRPNDDDAFISLQCVSTLVTTTENGLKTEIEKRNVNVIDIESDSTVEGADVLWNVDEADSNPTDRQRCPTSNLGEGVVVLVMDSGCRPSGNPTICKNFLGFRQENECFDIGGHGTRVASVVADELVGVAPNATIGCLRVLGFNGRGSAIGLVNAMMEAIVIANETDKKVVVNMSFGVIRSRILNSAARILAQRVDAIVVSSGNSARDVEDFSITSIADNKKIFVVAAHDENGDEGEFSNIGERLKITAPGVNITTRTIFGQFRRSTGTSFSAPHVAGAAAALFSDGKEVTLETLTSGNETVTFALNNEPVKKLTYECGTVRL